MTVVVGAVQGVNREAVGYRTASGPKTGPVMYAITLSIALSAAVDTVAVVAFVLVLLV